MKVIKSIVLGLGLLIVYPLVLINRFTFKSGKMSAKLADYVVYFCESLD
jgi:hypothetical protein